MEQSLTEMTPELPEKSETRLREFGRFMLENWGFRKNIQYRMDNPLPQSRLDNFMTYGTMWPDPDNPWNSTESIEGSLSPSWRILGLTEEEVDFYQRLSSEDRNRYLDISPEERTEFVSSLDGKESQ